MLLRAWLLASLLLLAGRTSAGASSAAVSGFAQTGEFEAHATVVVTHSGCTDQFGFCNTWYTAAFHRPTSVPCAADSEWISWIYSPPNSGDSTPQTVSQPSAILVLQDFGDTHLCVYVSDVMGEDLVADVPLAVAAPDPSVDHDCPEFPNQWSAQDFLEQFGNGSDLDRDLDGVACESNRNPSRGPSPHPWPVELLPPPPPPPTTPPPTTPPPTSEPSPAARIPTLTMDAAATAASAALRSRGILGFGNRQEGLLRCERRDRLQAACSASWTGGHVPIGRGARRHRVARFAFRGTVTIERTGVPASWETSWQYRVRRTTLRCVREHRVRCSRVFAGLERLSV
jgi:hypothetical protein